MGKLFKLILSLTVATIVGCSSASEALNPFYEPPKPLAYQGELSSKALAGNSDKINTARAALESMATYQRAHTPKPYNPVMNPAVVRIMWIPDHLNSYGDLVPAHYYYLKVLNERWAVKDAFELEGQLQVGGKNNNNISSIPYVLEGQNN